MMFYLQASLYRQDGERRRPSSLVRLRRRLKLKIAVGEDAEILRALLDEDRAAPRDPGRRRAGSRGFG
jgi:HEPN domain-containing protein